MSIFPIDDTIVPRNVTESYLSHYDVTDKTASSDTKAEKAAKNRTAKYNTSLLTEGAALVKEIIAEKRAALAKAQVEPTPGANTVTLIIGPTGVGKSTRVKELMQENGAQVAVPDVDDILGRLPTVKKTIAEMNNSLLSRHYANAHYSSAHHHEEIEVAVGKFVPLGEAIRDQVASALIGGGHNVVMQMSGKSAKGGDLIDSIKTTGATVHAQINDAPFSVIKAGAHSNNHGVSLPEDVLKAHQNAMRANIPVIEAHADTTAFFWRDDVNKPLKPVSEEAFAMALKRTAEPSPKPAIAAIAAPVLTAPANPAL